MTVELRMRRNLGAAIAPPQWPAGTEIRVFSEAVAPQAHALLALAYAKGGGSVPSFEQWWAALLGDKEYDPALCFAVWDGGEVIAFAQCWLSAFVKDLAVHPEYRRRGIGRALLLHIFGVFQGRGAPMVDLKVTADNPSGALAFYKSLGMAQVATD